MFGAHRFVFGAHRTMEGRSFESHEKQTCCKKIHLQMEEITKRLGPQDYETKTQGSRHVEPARALGEGALLHAPYLQPIFS